MSLTKSDTTEDSASVITDTRTLQVKRMNGTVNWQVNEFNHGANFMLHARCSGVQFDAHFDADQWAAFQATIAGTER